MKYIRKDKKKIVDKQKKKEKIKIDNFIKSL